MVYYGDPLSGDSLTAAVGPTRNEEGRRPQGVWRRDSGAMREREHEREALVGVAYGRGASQERFRTCTLWLFGARF